MVQGVGLLDLLFFSLSPSECAIVGWRSVQDTTGKPGDVERTIQLVKIINRHRSDMICVCIYWSPGSAGICHWCSKANSTQR